MTEITDTRIRESILEEVHDEREYQQVKRGDKVDDVANEPAHWISIIAYRATTWMISTNRPYNREIVDRFRKAMIEVAATAVAAVESIDRQRGAKGHAFYELSPHAEPVWISEGALDAAEMHTWDERTPEELKP